MSVMISCPQIEQALKHCLDFSAARKVQSDLMADVSDALSKVAMGKGTVSVNISVPACLCLYASMFVFAHLCQYAKHCFWG